MQESPLVPFPPEPTREEDEEEISDNYQRIGEANACYQTENGDWKDQSYAKRYLLFLIVHSSHRLVSSRQDERSKYDVQHEGEFCGKICSCCDSSSEESCWKQ